MMSGTTSSYSGRDDDVTNGVYCLEGKWKTILNGRASVGPILDLLTEQRQIKSHHSPVINGDQIGDHLAEWGKASYGRYMTLYLAMHGSEGHIHWSSNQRDRISLAELAELMPDNAGGCYIYFGSCLTLADTEAGTAFVKKTGVSALLGYEDEIDWIEGAAFEVILLCLMANHDKHPKALYDQIMADYGGLADRLGLVMITSRGVRRARIDFEGGRGS